MRSGTVSAYTYTWYDVVANASLTGNFVDNTCLGTSFDDTACVCPITRLYTHGQAACSGPDAVSAQVRFEHCKAYAYSSLNDFGDLVLATTQSMADNAATHYGAEFSLQTTFFIPDATGPPPPPSEVGICALASAATLAYFGTGHPWFNHGPHFQFLPPSNGNRDECDGPGGGSYDCVCEGGAFSPPPSPPPPSPPGGTVLLKDLQVELGFDTCTPRYALYLEDPLGNVPYGLLYANVDTSTGQCVTNDATGYTGGYVWPIVELPDSNFPSNGDGIFAIFGRLSLSVSAPYFLRVFGLSGSTCMAYYYLGADTAIDAYHAISQAWPAFDANGELTQVTCTNFSPPPPLPERPPSVPPPPTPALPHGEPSTPTAVAAAAESPATFSAALATTTRLTAAAFAALARCTATLTPTAQSADGPHRFHRGVRVPLRRPTGSSTAALAAAALTAAHATTTPASLASAAAAQPATEHSALLARGLRLFRSLQCEGLRGR